MKTKITNASSIAALLLILLFSMSFAQGDNNQDPMVNLGCLESAVVTGSVPDDSGRGIPTDILYNPATGDYVSNVSGFHEYGLNFKETIGGVTKENPFYWQVEWPTAKNINYITALSCALFGNQPQPTTGWAIQIWDDITENWKDLAKADNGWQADSLSGTGGWINGRPFEWRGFEPVVTKKVRFCAFANPDSLADGVDTFADSLWSFAFIGNTADGVQSTLIQYLDFSDAEANNEMDEMVNLGLLPECVASASFQAGELDNIRGTPYDLLFDPIKGDFYYTGTPWGEFGYPWEHDAGYLTYEEPFYWMAEWPVPKNINYFTWGGVYGNQPQPTTPWAVEYWDGSEWVTVIDGVGGSFEEGMIGVDTDAQSVWQSETPIQTKKFRLAVWSDGIDPLFSYHIRGRGGSTLKWDETDSTFKAILLQYKDLTTDVEERDVIQPSDFNLYQNYPNPFNPSTNIGFSLEQKGHVQLAVYNLRGQVVAVLVDENKQSGYHQVSFDANTLSSGVYYYKLKVNQNVLTRKMLLLK